MDWICGVQELISLIFDPSQATAVAASLQMSSFQRDNKFAYVNSVGYVHEVLESTATVGDLCPDHKVRYTDSWRFYERT
jgi:hypothetical protein